MRRERYWHVLALYKSKLQRALLNGMDSWNSCIGCSTTSCYIQGLVFQRINYRAIISETGCQVIDNPK